jgi:hypothetical protein
MHASYKNNPEIDLPVCTRMALCGPCWCESGHGNCSWRHNIDLRIYSLLLSEQFDRMNLKNSRWFGGFFFLKIFGWRKRRQLAWVRPPPECSWLLSVASWIFNKSMISRVETLKTSGQKNVIKKLKNVPRHTAPIGSTYPYLSIGTGMRKGTGTVTVH